MKLLTTHEVAAYITEKTGHPMSVRQVQHEIKIGKIKAEKIAGTYLVKPQALEHYKRRHPGPRAKKKKAKP
ncbi:hypothetical protein AQUSIP_13150 [Aquicella siphonis]|uniref:Helix-turn-helix domain-containing protein n=1 Tax=Aquicella siphonis TaxID=254247 RepID=A0A5E4PGL3_9COXI|nr:helix-turn-helix domain-containing protein [Aquicella siphonis]VVC76014.1 hypothetical protein AQUSIP_13150 [Aquicella siphonis]